MSYLRPKKKNKIMFNLFKKKKIIVTHAGSFHADDIFACATLSILLKKQNQLFKIVRTRDPEIIKKCDFVFDIGAIYDPKTNRFDHHQTGGAGARINGIPYAAFGLAWKHFGKQVCDSEEVENRIDQFMVSPIDASDNGVDIYKPIFPNLAPFRINEAFSAFLPSALENIDKDIEFLKMVDWAKEILKREIKKNTDEIKIEELIKTIYRNTPDKRLMIIEEPQVSRYEIWNALQEFSEPLFVAYKGADVWRVVAMRADRNSFGNRKDFPKNWAGLR